MNTDHAQHPSTPASTRPRFARVGVQLRQLICGLHGHDALRHFEQGRVSLLCPSCGYNSPGWNIKDEQPQPDTARPRMVRIPLVGQRRVA
jgi:hypothetical protein